MIDIRQEFNSELQYRFPNVFRHKEYVGVGPGWWDIIRNLSSELEAIIEKLPEEERLSLYVVQIKEKFGGLRFYMNAETDEMFDLITKAEEESLKICEECGKEGAQFCGIGWIKTFCESCRKIERK